MCVRKEYLDKEEEPRIPRLNWSLITYQAYLIVNIFTNQYVLSLNYKLSLFEKVRSVMLHVTAVNTTWKTMQGSDVHPHQSVADWLHFHHWSLLSNIADHSMMPHFHFIFSLSKYLWHCESSTIFCTTLLQIHGRALFIGGNDHYKLTRYAYSGGAAAVSIN